MDLKPYALVAVGFGLAGSPSAGEPETKPVKVEITKLHSGYQLLVGGKPFYIKGAGLAGGSMEKLARHGGNSFRTWHADGRLLDEALKNRLYVTMGLPMTSERHGFDYNDTNAVARQLARIKEQVLRYKDHPALIIWAIGNELNLETKNPKVWDAVNQVSKMIHQVDTNHLTTSPLAGINPELIRNLKTRAPDLDLLAFQMYGDIVNLPRYLRETGWDGPYIITEWGATGHWEVGKTAWGAPLENDSATKADLYLSRYKQVIAADEKNCLGSYAFLWGQKQERTPTWYGLFLQTGEETPAIDSLHYLWRGEWPANRGPHVEGLWLDAKTTSENVRLNPGQSYKAKIAATDPDGDSLSYRWVVMEESTDLKTGGDFESTPKTLVGLIDAPARAEVSLTAPSKPGAYRLFAYVYDSKGHAGHANLPFYVGENSDSTSADAGK
jgi:hypothetical protein